ncbi:MAG: hypothetical protein OXE99_11175 [Cellvibrionales bacterium]|nr:hypothetical protein [Cellvibrionales bacterium]
MKKNVFIVLISLFLLLVLQAQSEDVYCNECNQLMSEKSQDDWECINSQCPSKVPFETPPDSDEEDEQSNPNITI